MPRVSDALVARQGQDGFVTVAEASRLTAVHERTLRAWTRSGYLPIRRVGPKLVFVEVASLLRVTGGWSAAKSDEPVRELTLERDE